MDYSVHGMMNGLAAGFNGTHLVSAVHPDISVSTAAAHIVNIATHNMPQLQPPSADIIDIR